MNEYDIDEAASLLRHTPVYGPAAIFLQDFKDLINSISDGWHYWSYGTKCAQDLEKIVQEGAHILRPFGAYRDTTATATEADVKKATKKIQTFLKRCKQTQSPDVQGRIPQLNTAVEQVLL